MVPREKKTMLMENLGGQTKSIMVFSEMAYTLGITIFSMNTRLQCGSKISKLSNNHVLNKFKFYLFVFKANANWS